MGKKKTNLALHQDYLTGKCMINNTTNHYHDLLVLRNFDFNETTGLHQLHED
jgi:hypothetical protein